MRLEELYDEIESINNIKELQELKKEIHHHISIREATLKENLSNYCINHDDKYIVLLGSIFQAMSLEHKVNSKVFDLFNIEEKSVRGLAYFVSNNYVNITKNISLDILEEMKTIYPGFSISIFVLGYTRYDTFSNGRFFRWS